MKLQQNMVYAFFVLFKIQGPFCDPNMLFLWYSSFSRYRQNKLISYCYRFWLLFVSYACFTVSHCCISHIYWYYYYADIINRQCSDYFAKQINLQEIIILHTNIMYIPKGFYWCKNVNFFEKSGGWGCGSWNGPLNSDDIHIECQCSRVVFMLKTGVFTLSANPFTLSNALYMYVKH